MGEWIFMARKACTPPFPYLNPNPGRSFLRCGRGDYPKREKGRGKAATRGAEPKYIIN